MARRLQLTIAETEEFLAVQLKQVRTASQKERLQMLWWLKTGQVQQHQELAQRLGRNGSTVSRWLQKYRTGGLSALLYVKTALLTSTTYNAGSVNSTKRTSRTRSRVQKLRRDCSMAQNRVWFRTELWNCL
ncbi:MAG TPA: helix-turn-helix domain-containing protein [Phormidium sp.]